jgi:hypothetical protein
MRPEEERDLIERYYRKAVAWAPSDEEELAIARELLEKAQRGFVVDDTGERLLYARDPELPVDAEFLVDEGAVRQQRLRHAVPILGAFLVAILAVFLVYGGALNRRPSPAPTAATRAPLFLATHTLTPKPIGSPAPLPTFTPEPTATSVPTLTPTPLPPEEVEVKPQPVKLEEGAVVPVSLEVAGRYFPVVPSGLRDGHWAYVTEADQVSWLAGSYVNVVLGLPYTDDNLDLLASTLRGTLWPYTGRAASSAVALSDSLTVSSVLTVRNSVGGTNHYRVVERRQVDVYAIEVLGQRRAGLTLVLLGGNEESADRRLVIWATPLQIVTGDREGGDPQPTIESTDQPTR